MICQRRSDRIYSKIMGMFSDYRHSAGSNVIKQYATVSEWGIGYWKKKYLRALHRIEKGYLRKAFRHADRPGRLRQDLQFFKKGKDLHIRRS